MSVRVRVAVALVVAAVVPLVGVFALAGVLLPQSVGAVTEKRMQQAAAATASLLVSECAAVGDRAALVASRVQVAVSIADPEADPALAVAGDAERIVASSAGPGDPWSVVLLDGAGEVLASAGDDAADVADDPAAYLDRSCGTGVLGRPAVVGVVVPVVVNGEQLGTVLAVAPLTTETVDGLAETAGVVDDGTAPVDLVVLAGGELVATTSGLAVDDDGTVGATGSTGSTGGSSVGATAGEETSGTGLSPALGALGPTVGAAETTQRVLAELVERVGGDPVDGDVAIDDDARRGAVEDRPYVVAGPVLQAGPEGVLVVAVGEAVPPVDRRLAIAFVVTAFGAAALVWFLSNSLTRPLTELAEMARRIATGDDREGTQLRTPADADADVKGVSAVLGSLARDLRNSEADAQRRRGAFLDAFSRFGDALQQTHDRDGLLQTVLQAALLAAEAPMGLALHHDRTSRLGRRVLSLRARSRDDGPDELDEATRQQLSQVAERALAERAVIEIAGTDTLGPVLAVPLGSTSRPLGAVVVARDPGAPGYDAVAFEAIGALATNAGTALANIKDHQEVERLSVTDPLTGVNNFRHLSTMLARELERASRFGHPLGVLMLDIDRFKPVNDTYGHAAGDAVLRELARRVQECVREVDTVARYGGEEFALLLPETDIEGSTRLAQRVLASIRSEVFRLPDGPDIVVTASMGVAAFPDHGATATDVMRAADEALYRAKSGGRDRVEVAGSLPVSSPAGASDSPARDVAP